MEDADIDLESLEEIDLNLDLDLDSDIDDLATEEGPDLDFVNDFDLMTSDTYNMYTAATDTYDDNQLGSNVKINDPVKMYLKEIGRVELLSHDEEIELAKRILDGDEEAKKRLAAANLRLVVSIAKCDMVD